MGLMELGCKHRGFGRGVQPAATNCPNTSLLPDPTGDIGAVRGVCFSLSADAGVVPCHLVLREKIYVE
jgi:hypothetical protein